jgi:hypothetical protein
MKTYTIGMASDCPLDDDFFKLIEKVAHSRGLTSYIIYPFNVDETIFQLKNNQIRFLSFYDRASDTSAKFLNFYSVFPENQIFQFSNLELQNRAADKSIMHGLFVKSNLNVPKTVIIPEYLYHPSINILERDLDFLGRPFVIKPSIHTGSGSGVFLNGYSMADIAEKRKEFPEDKYLIQEKIYPREIYLKRFWFRAFYICGTIITSWWHDYGHRYEQLSERDLDKIDLNQINQMMFNIHELCGLNFFSTEFAITDKNKVYAIDYVNEICDMRLNSKYIDGVPDEIVKNIAEKLIGYIIQKI